MKALLNLVLMLTLSASAANWYVRPGGSGSRTGIDWNNAWDCGSIAWASVSGGDTIWMAGGTYSSGIFPAKSGSAGNFIYIKRVLSTDSVPVSAAGWASSFDSQVIIHPSGAACVSFSSGSYTYWDGRMDSGIKLQFPDNVNKGIGTAVYARNGQTQVIFTNIDMAGPWGTSLVTTPNQTPTVNLGSVSYFTFANCRLHGAVDPWGDWDHCNHLTFDHCKIYDGNAGSSSAHPNLCIVVAVSDLVIKYCEVWNWCTEGFSIGANCGAMYMYGNIFRDSNSNGGVTTPRLFETSVYANGGGTSGANGPLYFCNNTLVNIGGLGVWTSVEGGYWVSGSIVRNNIVWNCGGWPSGASPSDSDYNYGSGNLGESHSINGSGQSPFVNLASKDLHIVSAVTSVLPRNKGTPVSAAGGQTFNIDADGNLRGGDGSWDIGAYEYSTGSTNPVISVSPSTLTFGGVALGMVVTNYFTVQNVGSGILAGNATISGGGSSFAVCSGGSYSLGANQGAEVGIRYSPSSSSDNAVVTFTGGGQASANVNGQLQVVMSDLTFPSYAGVITVPFVTNSGGYVSQTVGTGVSDGGTAVYAFRIINPGDYTVSASVNAPSDSANSFYLNIDAQPTDPTMIWDIPVNTGFANEVASWRGSGSNTTPQYAPKVFNLSSGVHQLIIVGREAGAQLGQITIAPYSARPTLPAAPVNLRVVASQ